MNLAWTHFGPARKTSVAVPPKPSLIDWYVLSYDESLEKIVYLCRPDDGQPGAEMHAFDGSSWEKATGSRFQLVGSHLEGGGYDSSRRAVVGWGFDYSSDREGTRAQGVVITPSGVKALETNGDDPIVEPEREEDDIGTFDKHGLFAFDRAREVWVCLTRRGVWELDAAGTWSKKSDGAIVPQDWHDKTGEGTYDPLGKRTVFMMQSAAAKYAMVVLTWDGRELRKLAMTGLPALTIGLNNSVAQIVGHARHGLILHAGAGKLFAATATSWKPLPATSEPPPMMESACLAYDPKRDLMVLGPGKHQGAGGSDRNDVFFVLRNGTWERQGVVITYSPLASASYGNCSMAHVGGTWFALGTHSLRTWKWSGEKWDEIVDKKVGEKIGGWESLELIGTDRLYAVMQSGAVFALDGDRWTSICKKSPAFKDRTGIALTADPSGRLVVWGGEAKGRKLNDTLFFEGKIWRVAKKSSPQPADFKHGRKDDLYVGTSAIYDTALGAIVRFGFEEVAVLQDDETWKQYSPKGYKSNVSERLWGHVPVHDSETGETLILDFAGDERKVANAPARLVRFDLGGCVQLGTVEYPPELARKRQHDAAPYYALAESFSYDPMTRSLYAQVLKDSAGTYRLDLAEAFAQAKALGPRTIPKRVGSAAPAGFAPARLYRIGKGKPEFCACEPSGNKVAATIGEIGTKGTRKDVTAEAANTLIAAKRKAGFVPAERLPREALATLVGIESREIDVTKAVRGAAPASRLGGLPSGVTPATWPRVRGAPMGFLFQIETGKLLPHHAGVAVFCALDGEATNEPDENAVVLLKPADFKKTCPAPQGVPVLPVRGLSLDASKTEIDEDRAQKLGASDPDLVAAFERLQSMKGMQKENLATKLGGVPQFLQEVVTVKDSTFVGQIDFDDLDVSKAWPDAGLMGCIYVFVRKDAKKTLAFWQYT